jgi:hypothetical protein
MKSFKQYIEEDWKRMAMMGTAAVAAGAATGAITGLGAIPGGIISGLYYGLTDAKDDLKMKSGDWNYNKKEKNNVRRTHAFRPKKISPA